MRRGPRRRRLDRGRRVPHPEADAKEALDALESAGTPGMAVFLDVTESVDQEAFRRVSDEAGPVTGLVNNAGYSATGCS